jgi:hypothetical protein
MVASVRNTRASQVDTRGTLRIHDFGEEVHLWIEQRVPWTVALDILKVLTDPEFRPQAARSQPRRPRSRGLHAPKASARSRARKQAA